MKCCDLTSGKLRHIINIERAVQTPDGAGGSTQVWQTVTPARAWIKPISGGERLQALRLESDVTTRVFVRYGVDVTASDRINYTGRLYVIKAVLNLEEANKWLEIYAVEGPAT